MKKHFKFYIIIWAVLLAIYNLTVFLAKPVISGYSFNYDARFWISWGVIIATFIGQLFCSKIAFDSENNEKLFLNISLITQSYTALVIAMVIGSVLMLIPDCPAWIAAIVCATVLCFSAIAVIKAKVTADIVDETENKIKTQTFFIKSLTVDAENLMSRAKSEAVKAECKKVYEAVRYSDPMSSNALASVESEISITFAQLSKATMDDNAEVASTLASALLALLGDRNKKCKLLK